MLQERIGSIAGEFVDVKDFVDGLTQGQDQDQDQDQGQHEEEDGKWEEKKYAGGGGGGRASDLRLGMPYRLSPLALTFVEFLLTYTSRVTLTPSSYHSSFSTQTLQLYRKI